MSEINRSPESGGLSLFIAVALFSCFVAGCGNKGGMAAAQQQGSPKAIEDAFKDAKPEIRAEADQVAAAIQNQEAPKAFMQLQQLSSRPDLSSEQSVAAARAMAAVRGQLAAAAARGDKAAAELLEMYRSTK